MQTDSKTVSEDDLQEKKVEESSLVPQSEDLWALESNDKNARLLAYISVVILLLVAFPVTGPGNFYGTNFFISLLNLAIYLTYGYAAWSFVKLLKDVSFEVNTANKIATQCDELLDKYGKGSVASPTFSQLNRLIPDESLRQGFVGRLIQRTLADAREYVYDERESVLSPYRTEIYRSSLPLEAMQSLALRLGILGTFIGLIFAISELADISNGFDTETAQGGITESAARSEVFVGLSEALFGAMKFAFGTSVSGLLVSLLVTAFIFFARGKMKQAVHSTESAIGKIVALSRRATIEDKGIQSSFVQLSNAVESMRQDTKHQLGSAFTNVQILSQSVMDQTKAIQSGLRVFEEALSGWRKQMELITNQQEQQTSLQQSYNETMEKSISLFHEDVANHQKYAIEQITSTLSLLSPDALNTTFKEAYGALNASIDQHFVDLKLASDTNLDQITGVLSELNHKHSKVLESNTNLTTDLRSEMLKIGESFHQFFDRNKSLVDKISLQSDTTQALVSQLKVDNKLDVMHDVQRSLNEQLPVLSDFQKSLESSVNEMRTNPLDVKLVSQVTELTEQLLMPMTHQLRSANANYQNLQSSLHETIKVSNDISSAINTLNKSTHSVVSKLNSKSFQLAMIVNSLLGFALAIAALAGLGYGMAYLLQGYLQ